MKIAVFLAGLLCVVCVPLFAQSPGGPGMGGPGMRGPAPHGFAGGPMAFGIMRPGKVVTGQPYSADVTNAMQQTLMDGNTISRTTSGHVSRDSQGRTYSQETIEGGPWAQAGSIAITFIADPVAGYTYVLNPAKKIAMRRALKPRNGGREGMRPPFEGDAKDSRVETDLGQQTIGGINAIGKSVTRTIPAGTIGNSQPIVEKSEVWTAPDLQVVVRSTHNDPRWGQSTYTLTNVRRGEPSPALFQVPADYTVQDEPSGRARP